ncbi:signal peptidase I [Bradyrhizobium yuanmingense]|uniref:signal peptidase I n=1 Tax=Bradyrhizobium yuanmingense TaxID=108015 RepID=UPI0023BA2E3E|nr:signal peptidase I [Bradyrhizobium yuanmingense]MDF0518292.1 signal peptidase I [Bradyrhizobium yuanmingense]
MTVLQESIRPAARSSDWKAIVVLILMIPVLWSPVILFRFVLYQPFNIPSGSMTPALMVGDYVFAAKYTYGYGRYSLPFASSWISGRILAADPEYGDIVVFRTVKDGSADYVKRLVGLPGDRIQMRQGRLILNGRPVTRVALEATLAGEACGVDDGAVVKRWRETLPSGASYVTYDCLDNGYLDNTDAFTVPPGHFFVLGDNRDNSTDSRMPTFGFVPMDNLIGKVTRIFWSLDEDGEPRFERIGKVE